MMFKTKSVLHTATFKVMSGLMLLPALLMPTHANAAADVNFHGTLIIVACQVNADKPVNVEFGDEVITDLIDGDHYEQDVPAAITCSDDYDGSLDFQIKGTAIDFDSATLVTSVTDLGVKLMMNDAPMEINKSYTVTAQTPIAIKAVPVKAVGATLPGGEFTATATLLITPL
jgi:type 1 fimbria pilin